MKALRAVVFALVIALCAVAPAVAQIDQGRLIGTVVDAQRAVLPGVTITATSPSLIGSQTAVTEGDGSFRFPALPSGRYTLTFELAGFQGVKREGIVLALGQTLTVDAQLQVAALAETITVSGASPVVDTQATKVGAEFSSDKLAGIPSATDIWAALSQAPGVRMVGFDVGGSHKSQQVGYESFGIRNQNRVLTDGVDTTEGTGGAGFYQDFFAHEEIAVAAAGADVEMYTPGSAVFSSIKSGGNQFKGLYNLTYEDGSFVGDNIDDETKARGFTGQPNLIFWEGHADLGGPIKRDKVWFYGALNHFKIDKEISGVAKQFSDLGIFDNRTVKGTYKMTSRDTLIGYYQWGRKYKPRRGLSASTPPESILAQDSRSWMYKGEHQRVWNNRLFTDLRIGLFGFGWPMVPAVDPKTNPPRLDVGTSLSSGAGWNAFTFDRNKPQINGTVTYFLPDKAGTHDFKFGYEYLNDQSKYGINGNSGTVRYLDLNGQVDRVTLQDVNTFDSFGSTWKGADDRNQRHAFYAQDRWSLNQRVTLTLGLRWDRQRPHYEAGVRNPILTDVFSAQTTPARTIFGRNVVVPRLGVSYDAKGDGKSVIRAFYGRYYFNFADTFSGANPGGNNTRTHVFNDLNGNRLYDGRQELGTLTASSGGASTVVDPNLNLSYSDEFNMAFEKQFWGESSVRVAYVRKMVRDLYTVYNTARVGQFTVARQIPVVIRDFGSTQTTTRTFTLYDIPDSLRGVVTNAYANIPDGEGNYDTVQFAFNKRFGGGLFLQSSFDYQWRDELRSTGATTSPLNSDPLGVAYNQNQAAFRDVTNRQDSHNWQGRLLTRYVFARGGIGAAVNLRVQSGWGYARTISATLPNVGTVTFFSENIDNNYSETVPILDVRVDKAFSLGGRYRFTAMADLFNALNSNAVTNFGLANGPNFNKIYATLDPRTFVLGARFDF